MDYSKFDRIVDEDSAEEEEDKSTWDPAATIEAAQRRVKQAKAEGRAPNPMDVAASSGLSEERLEEVKAKMREMPQSMKLELAVALGSSGFPMQSKVLKVPAWVKYTSSPSPPDMLS